MVASLGLFFYKLIFFVFFGETHCIYMLTSTILMGSLLNSRQDTPGGDYVGSRNFPLRGGKHSIWEGGTRGTAFIWAGSATGLIPSNLVGQPVMALMHGVDWLPTICVVAGVRPTYDKIMNTPLYS